MILSIVFYFILMVSKLSKFSIQDWNLKMGAEEYTD